MAKAKRNKRNKTVPRKLFAAALQASVKNKEVEENGKVVVTVDMNEVLSYLDNAGYTSKRSTISQRIYKLNKNLHPKLGFSVASTKRTAQDYSMFLNAFLVE